MLDTPTSRQPQDARRSQLIDATISTIAEHGLSSITLQKVAKQAGLAPSMVNFHFTSKQALLTATLEQVAHEFHDACEDAIANAGQDPHAAIDGLIDICFDPSISYPDKVAVWYAFWSETRARAEYQTICGRADTAFHNAIETLFAQVSHTTRRDVHVPAAALGLAGLVDSLWQQILLDGEDVDRNAARDLCRAYVDNLFAPGHFRQPFPADTGTRHDDGLPPEMPRTLPAWTYSSEDFFAQEVATIHRPAWQLVCHVSEIRETGAYASFEAFGEKAFVIRGEDGVIRAFHNVCRHRAHALVEGRGACDGLIRCPYHAWGYDFSGDLKAIAAKKTFPPFDNGKFGLRSLDCEIYMGFVYIRFESGGAPVAERYGPLAEELESYRFEDMEPVGELWEDVVDADWKNVWDNYLEDYHFPTGHPGLFSLMSMNYERQPDDTSRTARLSHTIRDKVKGAWSNRAYASALPDFKHLPDGLKRRWSYYFMYPSVSFDVYPEMMDFFHTVPLGPGRTKIRWRPFALPKRSREHDATIFLNKRVNMNVHEEDRTLIESVQRGLATSAYDRGVLSEKEVIVSALHSWVGEDMADAIVAGKGKDI